MPTLKKTLQTVGSIAAIGGLIAATPVPAAAQGSNPCAAKPRSSNPCAAKGKRSANPCAAKGNPCAARR